MRKLAIFSAAFTAAAAIYVYVLADARALMLAGACLLLSFLGRMFRCRRCAIAFLGAAAALLWCFGFQTLFLENAAVVPGEVQTVTVRVSELPRTTQYGASVYADLDGYGAVLYGGEALLELEPGDQVTCEARVEKSGIKPGGEESLYLRSKGIAFRLYAKSKLTVQQGRMTWPEQIRAWLRSRITTLYDGDTAGFLQAVLIGDRSGLNYAVQNRLSVAGISHTIAVSGMHVSMLLALLSFLCGKSPRLTALFGIPVVIGFALMTGASASVCRAAAMQILLLCAPLLGREHDSLTALGAAALVLLLIDPWAVADVSFQLSFSAVLGLILFASPIQNKLLSFGKKPGCLHRFLASGISATLGATVLTLPLTVFYFGMISLAALPVNLLCLWAVTAVFTLGLVSCVAGPVGAVLAVPVAVLVRYILGLCGIVADWPFAAAYPENPALMVWAAAAYILALYLLLTKRRISCWRHMSVLSAAFLVCLLLGSWKFNRGNMTFTAVDVGQGQCLILNTGGFTAVIDCGGSDPDDAGEAAARVLHSAGVTRVDALVLTHYDSDHAGGVPQLLDRVAVDRILAPALETDSREAIEAAAAAAGVPFVPVEREAKLEFESGWLRVMGAEPGASGNESSLCVLAKAAEYDILVTGDRSANGELTLLSSWAIPAVDLLVAGHHGAETSTSNLLLEHTRPETVLICVGEDNSYGHPSPAALQRIEASGAEVLRTDLMGTITITDRS